MNILFLLFSIHNHKEFMRSSDKSSILVYASEVATFIGMHKHEFQAKAWNSVWDRVDHGQHKAHAISQNNMKVYSTKQEYLNDLCDKSNLPRMDLKEISKEISTQCKSAHDMNQRVMGLEKDISPAKQVNPEVYKELKKLITEETCGTYGKTKEKESIAKHEDSHYVKVKCKNDKFYHRHYFELGNRKWGIGGRVDGKIGDTVIEVKNRRYKLFETPPIYETIQIECYMRLLGSDNAKLIQHIWKKGGSEVDEDIIVLKKNDQIWDEILKKTRDTAILFTKFLEDVNWQKEFLQCRSDSERQRIIDTSSRRN